MRTDTDILVIGAGPAGSTFTSQVAGSGYSVLLLDGQSEKTAKPCGGLLSPDAQELFARFDFTLPGGVLADPQIFSVRVIDLQKRREQYYRRCYFNMNRLAFDCYLLSLVPDSVQILQGRAIKLSANTDGTYTAQIQTDEEQQEIRCKYLVGADGASSLVRRTFFPKRTIKHYVAIQEWYEPQIPINPFYSCIFDPETSDSCSWTLFKNGYMLYGGAFASKGCREAFETQKSRLEAYFKVPFGKPVKTEACLVNSPRGKRDFLTGHGNIFLLGEAAGFISASSFEGISGAIRSGELLAQAFKKKHPQSAYRHLCRSLKFKFWLKTKKRIVTHTPWIRHLVMKSGLTSLH